MDYKITCSFGEIIDKITIMNLKLSQSKYASQHNEILFELNSLYAQYAITNKEDKLFSFLTNTNSQLWTLRDKIHDKLSKKLYDREYIQYTIDFHKIKYLRKQIKDKISKKYSGQNVNKSLLMPNATDQYVLDGVKQDYAKGNYELGNDKIMILIHKYKDTGIKTQFIADMYISYLNICSVLNITYPYFGILDNIVKSPSDYSLSEQFINFIQDIYCRSLLSRKMYIQAEKYIANFNTISNLGDNMSFFKTGDRNKTLFIYYMGGIGDSIILGRIVRELCNKYKHNKIKWLIDFKSTGWIFNKVFESIPNLTILYKPDKKSVGHFDYHCNLLKVYYYLNYKTYENIPTSLYLKDICVNTHQKHEQIINKLQISGNKSYMFNWHGNSNNLHEKYNRKMALENAIPLFKQKNINWIITTMDITNDEYDILREHENIYILKNEIENYDDTRAFCDTIEIFKYVEGVISTDTSLVHLSATMGIPTYILLTMGSHWFWCRNCDKTNWYPNATLIRQKKVHNWDNVINELRNILTDSDSSL